MVIFVQILTLKVELEGKSGWGLMEMNKNSLGSLEWTQHVGSHVDACDFSSLLFVPDDWIVEFGEAS